MERFQKGKRVQGCGGSSAAIYMGRCPKVSGLQVSRLEFTIIDRETANDKDFSLRSK